MTPREKAEQLIRQFKPVCRISGLGTALPAAKEAACILCDELISVKPQGGSWDDVYNNPHHYYARDFWKAVKDEVMHFE